MRRWLHATMALVLVSALGGAADLRAPFAFDDEPATKPATKPATRPDRDGPESRPARRFPRTRDRGLGPESRPTSGPASRPSSRPTSRPTTRPTTQPTTKPAKKPDRYLVVTGGLVYTVSGADLHGATVLCKNGKIVAIGRDVAIPEGAERLDAAGLHVYPGLIALNSAGVVGSEPVENSTDVFGTSLTLVNAAGITTVVAGNTAAKTGLGSVEGILLRRDILVQLRFQSPADKRSTRAAFDKARQYLREKEEYDRRKAAGDAEAKEPDAAVVRGGNERYLQLLKREKTARVNANSSQELLEVSRLARDYGLRVVVFGAGEGWIVADEMGRADLKAVVTPRDVSSRDERLNRPNGGSAENAAALYRSGVDVAVVPQSPVTSLDGRAGRDLINLPMEAAYAVRGGMPVRAAVESITLAAARVLGVDDRIGSIDLGKDADLIVTDGELLDFYTTVQYTVVNGRLSYDKSKESLFSHVRPRTPSTQPAPYKFWPRRFRSIDDDAPTPAADSRPARRPSRRASDDN